MAATVGPTSDDVGSAGGSQPSAMAADGLAAGAGRPVMYVALIPQFVDPVAGDTAGQGIVPGAIQLAVSMTVNALIVAVAGTLAAFLAARPSRALWQRRIAGTLLGGVAVLIAREVPQRARL